MKCSFRIDIILKYFEKIMIGIFHPVIIFTKMSYHSYSFGDSRPKVTQFYEIPRHVWIIFFLFPNIYIRMYLIS